MKLTNLKKLISIVFISILTLIFLVPIKAWAQEEFSYYQDISQTYAKESIIFLTEQGIFSKEDNLFRPQQPITRGEFATLLARTFGIMPYYPVSATFKDLTHNDSAYGYVEALFRLGMLKGNGQGYFSPQESLTRQDATVFLNEIINKTGYYTKSKVTPNYLDAQNIAVYAKDSVQKMSEEGFLRGADGYFNPLALITREQAASIAQKLYWWNQNWANTLDFGASLERGLKVGDKFLLEENDNKLIFTSTYGLDESGLMQIKGKNLWAVKEGNTLLTLNKGAKVKDISLTIAKGKESSSYSSTFLPYQYEVEAWAYDPFFAKTEYEQYPGAVEGLSSSGEAWTGFLRQHGRNINLDLGEVKNIDSVSLEFRQDISSGIRIPSEVNYAVSVDGEAWYQLGKVKCNLVDEGIAQNKILTLAFPSLSAQYIKISFPVEVYIFVRHLLVTEGQSPQSPSVLTHYTKEEVNRDYPLLVSDMQDIILLYSGLAGEQEINWTKEELVSLVGYVDSDGKIVDNLFDTALFLPFANSLSNKDSWYNYLDGLFNPGQQLDALNQAVAEVNQNLNQNRTYPVILTLPYPDSLVNDFGPWGIEGPVVSFNSQEIGAKDAYDNRFRAVQLYYQNLLSYWEKADYEYLDLVGIYWPKENIDLKISKEDELVKNVSKLVKEDNLKFLWIPYYGASGYENWHSYGFTHVILQPNYYADNKPDENRLDASLALSRQYNMGLELELDDKVIYNRYYYDSFYKQLNKGKELGINGVTNAYYAGSKTIPKIFQREIPEIRQIYDDLYLWIKGN